MDMPEEEPTIPDTEETPDDEELSAIELEKMRSHLSKDPSENLRLACILTSSEHSLLGSTWPGKVFHPNLPTATLEEGITLEEINEAREKRNNEEKLLANFVDEKGDLHEVFFDLLPLTEEQIRKSKPVETYALVSAEIVKREHNRPVEIDQQIISRVKALISDSPASTREYFIRTYVKGEEK